MKAGRDALGGTHAPLRAVITQAGHNARLIMVVIVQRIPRDILKAELPGSQVLFQIRQMDAVGAPAAQRAAVQAHMLKCEDHVQFGAFAVGIAASVFHGGTGAFAHRQQIVLRKHAPAHLLQVLMYPRAVGRAEYAGRIRHITHRRQIRKAFLLGNQIDDIHAETVDALLAPPGHHVKHGVAHRGVFPVQIDLLRGKAVQVVLVRRRIVLPGRAGEKGAPVVRLRAVFPVSPDVEIALGIVAGGAALDEPRMLVGSMIHHEIHDDFQAAGVCL